MEPEKQINNSPETKIEVETYAEDMAKAIEIGEGGFIKQIIHEQEENEIKRKYFSFASSTNKMFLFGGLFLFLIAVVAIAFPSLMKKNIFKVQTPSAVPIVFTDQNQFLDVTGFGKDKIIKTLSDEVNKTNLKNGGLEGIYLTEDQKIVTLRRFIELAKGNVTFADSKLVYDDFLLGAVNQDNKNLFILIKMRSIPDVFETMKSWEGKMFYDLYGFFGITLSADNKELLTQNFEDGIVQNKNARVLLDKNGAIVLMYLYADENSLIITNSELTAKEVMLRLASSKIRK